MEDYGTETQWFRIKGVRQILTHCRKRLTIFARTKLYERREGMAVIMVKTLGFSAAFNFVTALPRELATNKADSIGGGSWSWAMKTSFKFQPVQHKPIFTTV